MSTLNDILNASRERQNSSSPVTGDKSPLTSDKPPSRPSSPICAQLRPIPDASSQVASDTVKATSNSSQVASDRAGHYEGGKWVAEQPSLICAGEDEAAAQKRLLAIAMAEVADESQDRRDLRSLSGMHYVYPTEEMVKGKAVVWRVQLSVGHRRYHLGCYDLPETAGAVADNANYYLWQAGAVRALRPFNFPERYQSDKAPPPIFRSTLELFQKLTRLPLDADVSAQIRAHLMVNKTVI